MNKAVGISGIALIGLFTLMAYLSGDFSLEIPLTERPVILLTSVLVLSGAVYLFAVYAIPSTGSTKGGILFIIAIGLILRLLMFLSTPMLEDDYFRYLWDGAVTANGDSPYRYAPEEVVDGTDIPAKLTELKAESGVVIHNINHPHLRSIYPPISQALFALSYLIKPWSMTAWRSILLFFDAITLLLLFYALKTNGLPVAFLIVYWWNPLLVKEIFNSGHLDVLAFPFALGGIMLAVKSRYIRSAAALVAGIGIKLWPAFLLPLVLKPLLARPKRLIASIALACFLLLGIFLPHYISGLDNSSGLVAYTRKWQNNDSAFRILIFLSQHLLDLLGDETYRKYDLARVLAASLTVLWIGHITLRKYPSEDLFQKSLYIIAFVFLISPTQFPWYYTWLLPFLVLKPRFSLLLLTALLPLYYLRYYLEPRGKLELFNNVVVWIEFLPVWILLLIEWKMGAREKAIS
jgi:alpha-1,6-mannosyltransferase